MIYAESLRHFSQEWVEIQHPRNVSVEDWPWDMDAKLYIVNLYCVSATQEMTIETKPQPMVSILINGLPKTKPPIISETEAIYRGYFERPEFKLPRRYLYNPLNRKAERNQRPNRFDFTSNGYGEMASDWERQDLQFLKLLGSLKHVRRTMYDDPLYFSIRSRLNTLEQIAEVPHISMADNLLDATLCVQEQSIASPETFLVQVPVMGILQPIKKSKEYSLINGVLMKCSDDCMMAIPDEPCYKDYMDALTPFQRALGKQAPGMPLRLNNTKLVAYMVVETPKSVFQFQEFLPGDRLTSNGVSYVRTLTHHFSIEPELAGESFNSELVVRLRHHIMEGLLPNTNANKIYLTKRGVKLFHRSDIPNGFTRRADGEVTTKLGG